MGRYYGLERSQGSGRFVCNQCHLVLDLNRHGAELIRVARQIKRSTGECRSSSQEVLDQGFFLQEFGHRGIDLVTAEIVQANIWHDFAAGAGGADRE